MKIDTVVTKENIEMSYFSFGTGKNALVILPGIDVKSVCGAAKSVEAAYRVFAEDYTVYVFDRRCNLPPQYSIKEMADDTAAVMKELGIRDADVFGASQGGMMAICLAADHPELVHSVILGSTAAYAEATITTTARTWIEFAKARDITGLTADFIDRLYSAQTVKRFKEYLIHMNDNVSDADLDRFIILAETIFDYDAREKLDHIKCPVLAIGAENDRAIGADASREIARRLNCGLYLYGSEYGHCVFDEAPDYKERLLAFYKKNRE